MGRYLSATTKIKRGRWVYFLFTMASIQSAVGERFVSAIFLFRVFFQTHIHIHSYIDRITVVGVVERIMQNIRLTVLVVVVTISSSCSAMA